MGFGRVHSGRRNMAEKWTREMATMTRARGMVKKGRSVRCRVSGESESGRGQPHSTTLREARSTFDTPTGLGVRLPSAAFVLLLLADGPSCAPSPVGEGDFHGSQC